MATEAKATLKVKKKKWYVIVAPKLFKNVEMGEIPITEGKLAVGRSITVNLMTLTNDIKKQNANLTFVIDDMQNNRANTTMVGYFISPASVKRVVRRGKERINFSFVCKTSDNKNVRIKPLILPNNKVKGSISARLKRTAIDLIKKYAAKESFENLMRDIIIDKLQKTVKTELRKIYPLKIFEIATAHIEKEGKIKEEQQGPVVEETKGEEPAAEEEKGEEEGQKPKKENKVEEEQAEEQTEEVAEEESSSEDEEVQEETE